MSSFSAYDIRSVTAGRVIRISWTPAHLFYFRTLVFLLLLFSKSYTPICPHDKRRAKLDVFQRFPLTLFCFLRRLEQKLHRLVLTQYLDLEDQSGLSFSCILLSLHAMARHGTAHAFPWKEAHMCVHFLYISNHLSFISLSSSHNSRSCSV